VPVKSGGTLGETVSEVIKEEREFFEIKNNTEMRYQNSGKVISLPLHYLLTSV